MALLSYTTRRFGPYLDIEFNRTPGERVRDKLRAAGFSFHRTINSWRGTSNHDYALLIAQEAVAASERALTGHARGETLCVRCGHAAKGCISVCPWARAFEPVPGWTAKLTKRRVTHSAGKGGHKTVGVIETSYRVDECPLYVPDRPEKPRERGWTVDG